MMNWYSVKGSPRNNVLCVCILSIQATYPCKMSCEHTHLWPQTTSLRDCCSLVPIGSWTFPSGSFTSHELFILSHENLITLLSLNSMAIITRLWQENASRTCNAHSNRNEILLKNPMLHQVFFFYTVHRKIASFNWELAKSKGLLMFWPQGGNEKVIVDW